MYGHVITKFSGMGTFTYPWCSAGALRAPELRYKRCLLRSKTSAVKIRLVICDIFKNCFLFEVKILKEVRLSENSSILLGITDARNVH